VKDVTLARPSWRWLVVLGYMVAIYFASATPGDRLPSSSLWQHDKLIHAGVFSLLGALGAWAAAARPRRALLVLAWGWGVATLYGASDELHQAFVPGRFPDVWDLVADSLGAFAGAAVIALVLRSRRRP